LSDTLLACHCCELFDADRRQLLAAAKSDRDRLSLLLTLPDDREIRDLPSLGAADASAEGRVEVGHHPLHGRDHRAVDHDRPLVPVVAVAAQAEPFRERVSFGTAAGRQEEATRAPGPSARAGERAVATPPRRVNPAWS
jgi:hypothetical protein